MKVNLREAKAREMVRAFWGTKVMEKVKKHDFEGLIWKRIKLTSTRKANTKKRLHRIWQNEAVLSAVQNHLLQKQLML